MLKFCTPNLPRGRVKQMLVSSLVSEQIKDELIALGIEAVFLKRTGNISTELAYHPDILTLNVSEGKWIAEKGADYFPEYMNNVLTRVNLTISGVYPQDCVFNSYIIGDTVFCGRNNAEIYKDIKELKQYNAVCLKQSYTKCSVIILEEKSLITSDKSIEKALSQLGYNCLYVSNKGIGLNGFSCGFVGGCAGKISSDSLVFTGSIKAHKDYEEIKSFCGNLGISIYSLSNKPLYDYGGLLPVTEYSDK